MNHDGEEVAYVLNGVINLIIDNQEFVLNEGDSARKTPMTIHKLEE